ncbi:MAG: YggS family pyridoxal phosphate-dependent enzyme [Armatimonadota bacterium]
MSPSSIAQRLADVEDRIAQAARDNGRSPDDVKLISVSKTRDLPEIVEALKAGAVDLGENYAQEMIDKNEQLFDMDGLPDVRWHFIGHLQRNKAKYLVHFCHLIHSVDSVRLVQELDRRAGQARRRQPILVQLDLAHEETKFGAYESELPEIVGAVLEAENLDWRGLMCMAPYSDDPENSRPYYRRLAQIRDELSDDGVSSQHLQELSMGMSQDFEVAIEEGATMVRVGTAIFGPRES